MKLLTRLLVSYLTVKHNTECIRVTDIAQTKFLHFTQNLHARKPPEPAP